jgi:hypothetical protein
MSVKASPSSQPEAAMKQRMLLALTAGSILLTTPFAQPQEIKDQREALALLARIDGKATFDPAHPKRVIGIDL